MLDAFPTRSASDLTWWLVTMWARWSIRKPDPEPSRGMARRKKSISTVRVVTLTTAAEACWYTATLLRSSRPSYVCTGAGAAATSATGEDVAASVVAPFAWATSDSKGGRAGSGVVPGHLR